MLTLLMGTDWVANQEALLSMIVKDVAKEQGRRIWIVPEHVSHDTERKLCKAAGDTASRFAEVLSFTRLYRRVCDAAGHGVPACLDNGGRLVAMAAAARHLHSKLKAYASMETRPEFLTSLLDAVDDFKRCCITPDDLRVAAGQTEGSLAQKLEELSLLLQTYDAICEQGKRDPSDQMTWLLEQLEDSTFAADHIFYIDGFPDYTRQHMAILEHIVLNSPQVVIGLTCDDINTTDPAFETAANTASQILRWARDAGVPVDIRKIDPRPGKLEHVRKYLFQGDIQEQQELQDTLSVSKFDTVYDECLGISERVMKLIRNGARYRDINIVCSDMSVYRNTLTSVFRRAGIPVYQSGTDDILEKTVITTVLAAVDAALGGFERADVIRYLKSMLSPLELSVCDTIENYTLMWNITGKRWLSEWTNNPDGLAAVLSEEGKEKLAQLNSAREQVIIPLQNLKKNFDTAVSVSQQVQALYQFFDEIQLAERLAILADEMDAIGDNRNAQILDQLWEILLGALEQMHDVLGQTQWDSENFTRLFRMLLSQYDVGTIPPVLDAVSVGPVSAMRCLQSRHLFVVGAVEGSLPGYPGAKGVLTDQERVALRRLGVPLTGGAMEGIQAEFAEIYGVFCSAGESICVSYSAGQPSFLCRRLLGMVGHETDMNAVIGSASFDRIEAGAMLVRCQRADVARSIGIEDAYAFVNQQVCHTFGDVSRKNIEGLYGKRLNLSASQVDSFADCRLSYFLKYGMRAQERKPITVDPAEFGTYVHFVLEKTAREVMQLGGFHKVSLEKTLEVADRYSQEYAAERFSQIDSERIAYLFRRNGEELKMVVSELWEELNQSKFAPVDFEVAFGDRGEIDAIPIPGKTMDAQLRGFVDRVDAWKSDGNNFFRVVDYKTGKKEFDYCDVFNGYGLQMLLYLFALEDQGEKLVGRNSIPAGVQYFPARVPIVSADGPPTVNELGKMRDKTWKRKGLLLNDEDVLKAMEPGDVPRRMNYKRNSSGITGDIATSTQFHLLKKYVFALLGKMVDEIATGCVEPNPYTRGNSHNACVFCPYGAVCHSAEVTGRRNYKTMQSQKFWNEIEKEMKENG